MMITVIAIIAACIMFVLLIMLAAVCSCIITRSKRDASRTHNDTGGICCASGSGMGRSLYYYKTPKKD